MTNTTKKSQTRDRVTELVDAGEALDPLDLEGFYLWLDAAYEALALYPDLQQEFDRYCRGALDPMSVRTYIGIHILKNAGTTDNPSSPSAEEPCATPKPGSELLVTEKRTALHCNLLPQERRPHWDQQASESEGRASPPIIEKERRAIPRRHPLYEIRIFDGKDPRMEGTINNIHVKGLQVAGVISAMDELKTFVIHGRPYHVHEQLEFAAQCRWSLINEFGECVAGFQITSISKQGASALEKLLANLTVLGP